MTIFNNNKSTNFVKLHFILKNLFIKEKWFLFSASRCRCHAALFSSLLLSLTACNLTTVSPKKSNTASRSTAAALITDSARNGVRHILIAEITMGWVHPWIGLGWVGLNEKYCYFFTAFCVCYNIMCYENLQITRVMRTQCTDRIHAIVVLQKKAVFSLQLGNQSITTRNRTFISSSDM